MERLTRAERLKKDFDDFRQSLFPLFAMKNMAPQEYLHAYGCGFFISEKENGLNIVRAEYRETMPFGIMPHRKARKAVREGDFYLTTNQHFEHVLHKSAVPRKSNDDQPYIGHKAKEILRALRREGRAHSIETHQDGRVTGGALLLTDKRLCTGLSIYREREEAGNNAGTAAFVSLSMLLAQGGFDVLDAIAPNGITRSFGGSMISAEEFERQYDAMPPGEAHFATIADPVPVWGFIQPLLAMPPEPDARQARNERKDMRRMNLGACVAG